MYYYRMHEAQTTQKPKFPIIMQLLVTVDLHIVKVVTQYLSLHNVLIERYSNCLLYYTIMSRNNLKT